MAKAKPVKWPKEKLVVTSFKADQQTLDYLEELIKEEEAKGVKRAKSIVIRRAIATARLMQMTVK